MRNFGASCDKRRPDVRFCGVEAAGEEGLGLTRGYQLSGWYAGLILARWSDRRGGRYRLPHGLSCALDTAVTVMLTAAVFWSDRRPGNAMAGAAQLDQLRPAMAYSEPRQISAIGESKLPHSCRIWL